MEITKTDFSYRNEINNLMIVNITNVDNVDKKCLWFPNFFANELLNLKNNIFAKCYPFLGLFLIGGFTLWISIRAYISNLDLIDLKWYYPSKWYI